MRWDPAGGYLWNNYSGVTPARRRLMLLGNSNSYDPDFLEVDNDTPVGNGYRGLMEKYRDYLKLLTKNDWGALGKLFVFPVYGFGYNWSASNRTPGAKLAARIDEIIAEARGISGSCQKVILVTHSMGGLVATVPTTSSSFNGDSPTSPAPPANRTFPSLEHQPAYEKSPVQVWATAAITAIAGLRFKEFKG